MPWRRDYLSLRSLKEAELLLEGSKLGAVRELKATAATLLQPRYLWGVNSVTRHRDNCSNVTTGLMWPLPHTFVRHTFASYHFAHFKDAGMTAHDLVTLPQLSFLRTIESW